MMAEALPQIVWTADPSGWLDYYNTRWFEYTGLTLEQTQGWGWGPVLHPDDLQKCVDRWTEAFTTGVPYEIQYRFRRASDGVYRWHLGRALPVRGAKGEILKWIGTCTDIHDQIEAAEALRKWELVFRHSAWGVMIADADTTTIQVANPALERMHGYEPGEMTGLSLIETLASEEQPRFVQNVIEVAAAGRVVYESVHLRKDGSRFPVLIDATAVRDANGRVQYRVANYLDLTQRREAEAARQRAEARFRSVQDASPDTFVLCDVVRGADGSMIDGRVAYLNPAAQRMFEQGEQSLIGASLEDLFPGVLTSERFATYALVDRTGEIAEFVIFHALFGRWLRLVVLKVDDAIGIIGTDVTAHREAETVLRRSRDDLERLVADRTRELHAARDIAIRANQAKTNFLSHASHELRTPLNSVIGFSGILLKNRSGRLGADELAYAERIARNGSQLLGLVNDLLDLSKIEAGRVTLEVGPVSIFDLLHEVRESFSSRADEFGLTLVVEVPTHDGLRVGREPLPLVVTSDEQRLRQILLNLVGNAVKYTVTGGVVIRAIADDMGQASRIDVSDSGPGIDPARIRTIFEPFVVGDAIAQFDDATGLGLAIARGLCDMLGFELTVMSVVGKGTTFSVHLTDQAEGRVSVTPD